MPDLRRLSRNTLARGLRRLRAHLGPQRVHVVWSRRYQTEIPGVPHDPLRAERILTFLLEERLVGAKTVHSPYPVAFKWLRLVHTEAYLESVHEAERLIRILGFRIGEAQVERMLELQRSMVGGTLLATRLALTHGGIAINLGGGLHHAFADRGERFCVFNDVATAIRRERQAGFRGRVLVVDLDLHDSDGLRTLFAEDESVHTYSIHNLTTAPADVAAATVLELGSGVDDGRYLEVLADTLPAVFARVKPSLVFYLAGVDPAADDEIGDWRITPEGMLERDRRIVDLARRGVAPPPVVIVLGGGYGPSAWRYSARFFGWLASGGRLLEPPSTEAVTLARYRILSRLFGSAQLAREDPGESWGLTEEDVYGALAGSGRRTRLLGFYSRYGIELALEGAGILERLRSLGYARPTLELDLDNPSGETVRLFGDPETRELLMELRVRRDRRQVPGFELLRVEWLLLQNPRARFSPHRPRLPGQEHPGLGMLPDASAFLILACERLGLDGLLFHPAHYHLAAQGRSYLRFLQPRDEARFRALQGALTELTLVEASLAVEGGRVVGARDGVRLSWEPQPMVLPVSERFQREVMGEAYEAAVASAEGDFEFRLQPLPG